MGDVGGGKHYIYASTFLRTFRSSPAGARLSRCLREVKRMVKIWFGDVIYVPHVLLIPAVGSNGFSAAAVN